MGIFKRFSVFAVFATFLTFMSFPAFADCPYKTSVCAKGFHPTGNSCKIGNKTVIECEPDACEGFEYTKCPTGRAITGSCQSGTIKKYKCGGCKIGYKPKGDSCIKELNCLNGGVQEENECVCPEGWTGDLCQTKKTCSYKTTSCTGGYEETGETCKSGDTVYKKCQPKACEGYSASCGTGYHVVSGDTCLSGTRKLVKCEANQTGSDVGKIMSQSDAINYIDPSDGEALTDYANNGNINVTRNSKNEVIGLYSNLEESNNAFATSGTTNANIKVNQSGKGNVYGMKLDYANLPYESEVYNAMAMETGKATANIVINNSGNGNVYGMYDGAGKAYLMNAYAENVNENSRYYPTAKGVISIDNSGDGDVYGMYSANSVANAEAFDLYSEANGIIRISNSGSGNAYGMWSESNAVNGSPMEWSNNSGKVNGKISIINKSTGNAYAMFSNGGGRLWNETDKEGAKNITSVIEMANVGDGLVVGMYSKNNEISEYWGEDEYYIIKNSGEIKIHNLGEGIAIGIYADGVSKALNSGTITIDRANFVDDKATSSTGDDVTYRKQANKGGKAYGIYGVAGSSITNSGTININGADLAYGIYSEGGNVTNTGTINIDGNACTGANCTGANNAIVLNGGKLFQDGVLYVNDELVCGANATKFGGECICNEGYEKDAFGNCVNEQDEEQDEPDVVGLLFLNRNYAPDEINANNSNITLRGSGRQNIYGIKTVNTSVDIHNALSDAEGHVLGNTELTNNGAGNVYGMYGTPDNNIDNVYAYDHGTAEGYITITNNGTGNAFGIYSGGATNVRSTSVSQDNEVKGIIKIKNTNSGNAYGIASSCASDSNDCGASILDIHSGAAMSLFDKNAKGARVSSKIIISNEGSGDAYGLIGSHLYNVRTYGSLLNMDGEAIINITNKGQGNAYGLYGSRIYADIESIPAVNIADKVVLANENNGNIWGVMTGELFYHKGSGQSVIDNKSDLELINSADGKAIGLAAPSIPDIYAGGDDGGSIYNTGEIKIHNLGNGVAVGIYAGTNAYVANDGVITIDRESYTNEDTFDGSPVTYSATSDHGGKAIGIYGAAGSSITNSGTINISGADIAYGIYSEGGDVTNTGTINIDGNDNHQNAIKLNGGQLFQNGVLYAGADWGDNGGNTNPQLNCVHGTQSGDVCVCESGWTGNLCQTANTCASDYVASCGTGYHPTVDTCQSGNNTLVKCEANTCAGYVASCGSGYHEISGDTCQSGNTTLVKCEANTCSEYVASCGVGYHAISGDTCQSGNTTLVKCEANTCSGYVASCGVGYHAISGDTCQSGNNTLVKCESNTCSGYVSSCGNGYHAISGDTCQSGNNTLVKCEVNDCSAYQTSCGDGYNATQSCLSGTTPYYTCTPKEVPEGYTTTACGEGYTQVDTLLSGTDTYYKCEANTCASDYVASCGNGYHPTVDTCQSGNNTLVKCEANTCAGYVASCGSGYHPTNDTCQSGGETLVMCEADNTEPEEVKGEDLVGKTSRTNNEVISLTNDEYRDVYGLYDNGDLNPRLTNATSDDSASVSAEIRLTNNNNGDVYGIYSSDEYDMSNAWSYGGNINGLIDITNNGDGNAYGMKSSPDAHISNYDYGPTNALNYKGGNPQGTIKINNSANGNAYGIFGYNVHNAYQMSGGSARGIINIINQNSGNVYGLYANGGIATNRSNDSMSSTIQVINIDNGLAVGIYALGDIPSTSYVSKIENSGNIIIHNLGNGTAIGMYADGLTYALNTGTITIDHEDYVYGDSVDDVYHADGASGGKAIGIYGAADSSINNSGTIKISDADIAYGIYSEGGNVTNTGTINIDNVSCTGANCTSENNAIVLNGGMLFQDGVLYAGADWGDNGGNTNPQLNCVHGTQSGDVCVCESGWAGNLCQTANTCASDYVASCGAGYHAISGDTCQSGNNTLVKCEADNTEPEEFNETPLIGKTADENNENITITNNEYRDVYGVSGTYNAHNGDATVTITNYGDGDVYGVYNTGTYTYNVKNEEQDGTASGKILISNYGDGDVYGVYGTDNASSSIAEDTFGLISIHNSGMGNVYGMFNDKGNTYNVWGKGVGIINIVNHSNGNIYGIYGKYPKNISGNNQSSTIEIVNVDDGLVVGIYSKDGRIENSGDISINNLGNGTAVGIYADGTTSVSNTGTITIVRSDFVNMDPGDRYYGYTYSKKSDKGGKAIGIYGAAGSSINNGGTIKISDADIAYGIYSEGGNVTNTGTINIDNVSCTGANCTSENNAIVLNGGKLFQDGVLYAGADWGDNGGNTNPQLNCVHGTQSGDVCVCESGWTGNLCQTANTCASDYVASCGTGYHPTNDTCQSGGETLVMCEADNTEPEEVKGEALVGKTSRTNNEVISLTNDEYRDVYGVSGTYNADDSDAMVTITNYGDGDVYGMFGSGDKVLNANATLYNDSIVGTADGTISITNTGNGNVYGMYGNNEVFNAYSSPGTVSGTIEITDIGDGNVYGIFGNNVGNAVESKTWLYFCDLDNNCGNLETMAPSTVEGIININYTGGGNAYGIYGLGETAYNAYIDAFVYSAGTHTHSSVVNGIINVTNHGTGNAYGIYGNFVSNVYTFMSIGSEDPSTVSGTVNITNDGSGNAYGLYGNQGVSNTSSENFSSTINVTNNGSGNVYGMYSNYADRDNDNDYDISGINSGIINVTNTGGGNAYGIYGKWIRNGYQSPIDTADTGILNITNSGSGLAVGMYAKDEQGYIQNFSKITINNLADGSAIGMYANRSEIESYEWHNHNDDYSLKIINQGTGTTYGVYGDYNQIKNFNLLMANVGNGLAIGVYGIGNEINVFGDDEHGMVSSNIKIHNFSGTAIGIYGGVSTSNTEYYSTNIRINNDDFIVDDMGTDSEDDDIRYRAWDFDDKNSKAIGIYGVNGATVVSNGSIDISGAKTAIGIYAESGSDVNNSGSISVYGRETAIGIYGESGSSITNSGTITINGALNAYGIYSEGGNVTNTGTINIDGNVCTGANCTSENNAIVLNGGKLFQDGVLYVSPEASPMLSPTSSGSNTTPDGALIPEGYVGTIDESTSMSGDDPVMPSYTPASLNLNDFGGTVVASATSQFIVEGSLSGDLAINNNVIENGFSTTYSVKDMIQAADVSGLKLISQSALFDASLQNDSDAVMTMKSFDSVIENSSLAQFLQANYASENNETLFALLKGKETLTALNETLDSMVSADMFNRFTFEDLTMMRDLNADMNNTLFNSKADQLQISGNVTPWNFDGNMGSNARYALYNTSFGRKSLGLGIAFSDVRSHDTHRHKDSRYDRMFQMSVPMGYKAHGFKFLTTPRFGYAYGTYERTGYEGRTYDGKVEKRMFGLMNEARYPLSFGKWTVAPAVEFNAIGYHIKGHEEDKEYSLNIKAQNNYSLESGLGLYANRELKLSKNGTLKLNAGVAVYHEFANPYELELGMHGMDGSFKVSDERRKDNRVVLRAGFDYGLSEKMSLIGAFATYLDGTTHNNANLDLRYNF